MGPSLFDQILSRIVDEAITDPATGWLSNAGDYDDFEYEQADGAIYFNGNYESVDVYQLASIIEQFIQEREEVTK